MGEDHFDCDGDECLFFGGTSSFGWTGLGADAAAALLWRGEVEVGGGWTGKVGVHSVIVLVIHSYDVVYENVRCGELDQNRVRESVCLWRLTVNISHDGD